MGRSKGNSINSEEKRFGRTSEEITHILNKTKYTALNKIERPRNCSALKTCRITEIQVNYFTNSHAWYSRP